LDRDFFQILAINHLGNQREEAKVDEFHYIVIYLSHLFQRLTTGLLSHLLAEIYTILDVHVLPNPLP
jgi:hypothetical protein